MPVRKLKLNRAERQQYRRCVTQLYSEGIDFGDDVDMRTSFEDICPLEITASDHGFVYDSETICAWAVLPLRMQARERVIFENCHIEAASDELSFDIASLTAKRGRYYLGRDLSFPEREVLNPCLESIHTKEPFCLSSGHACEGVVLGYVGKSGIGYLKTGSISVQITVVDSLDREVEAEIQLGVRRVRGEVAAARNTIVPLKPTVALVDIEIAPRVALYGAAEQREGSALDDLY